ncbi:MAG: c-type cytochrome [Gammaproteobacteria bacterium]|nr:c-type cytochrome [Gammaproteobacteria bacterium]
MSKVNTYFGTSIGVAIVVAVIVVIINNSVGSALKGDSTADMSEEAIAERIAPVGKLNTGEAIVPKVAATAEPAAAEPAADTTASAGRPAKEIYNASCFACHGTGAAGAPMLGDAAAWAPRGEKGMDTLMNHAINGFNAMPPRGTCSSCSDEELRTVVEYMLESSQ